MNIVKKIIMSKWKSVYITLYVYKAVYINQNFDINSIPTYFPFILETTVIQCTNSTSYQGIAAYKPGIRGSFLLCVTAVLFVMLSYFHDSFINLVSLSCRISHPIKYNYDFTASSLLHVFLPPIQ